MAVYVVQGKLGTGKGKFVVRRIQDALRAGKRVAGNVDLYMEHLLGPQNRSTYIRLPDKPSAADLDAAGHGNPDSYNEEKNGVLVLDELGSWLNARSFNDKARAGILDWLIHARKKGWDCYLIVQNLVQIDKQVREALAEYSIKLIRADKMRVPVVGQFLGRLGKLPRFHIANTSMVDVPGVVVDREFFRADDLQKAYDTRQIFREWIRDPSDSRFESEVYQGPFSYLSPWHLVGRFQTPKISWWKSIFQPRAKPQPKQKHPRIAAVAKLNPDSAWAAARFLVERGYV